MQKKSIFRQSKVKAIIIKESQWFDSAKPETRHQEMNAIFSGTSRKRK